jgi:hypothetical protein
MSVQQELRMRSRADDEAAVARYHDEQLGSAIAHEWHAVGQFLVLDNSRTLHAPSAAAEGDLNRGLTGSPAGPAPRRSSPS